MARWTAVVGMSVALLGAACSSDDGEGGGDTPDAGETAGEYVSLVTAPWTMAQGSEGYICARVTVPEEIWIREFRPVAPLGTHHTALSIDTSNGADGVFPCEASTIGPQLLFGSGVGTTAFAMPEGVAFKVAAGERLLLNLHLYNVSDSEIVGESGIEVRLASADEVTYQAETIYAGQFQLSIPPGESTSTGTCTLNADSTIFGTFPHMHQLGVHMRGIGLPAAGGEVVVHDHPYDFELQLNYDVAPMVELKQGDKVRVECSYDNDTGRTVGFGDSSDDEMCILGLYRYPAAGGSPICFN
jgi:hypothetical protein